MKPLFPTERSLNRCLKPIRKNKNLQLPIALFDEKEEVSLIANGYFSNRHFIMLDFITYKCLKLLHNGNIPSRPDSFLTNEKILNDSDDILILKDSYDNNTLNQKKINLNLKIEECHIKTIPLFKNYSSNRIFEVLDDISKFEFKTSYQIRTISNTIPIQIKHHEYKFGINFIKIFDLNYVECKTNNRVNKREYEITFNSFFGNLFLNNLLSLNIDWYDYEKFCELSSSAQTLCRILKVNRNKDSTNTYPIKKLVSKLNLQNKSNSDMNIKYLNDFFTELKSKKFITDFEKRLDVNGINFVVCF